MAEFPKILCVNELRPDSLVMADCVRQLLVGYPADRIAWWYCRETGARDVADLHVRSLHRWLLPARLLPQRRLQALKGAILEHLWVPLAARHLRRTVAEVKPDLIWVLLYGWPILVTRSALSTSGRSGTRAPGSPRFGVRLHTSFWDFPDNADGVRNLGATRAQRMLDAIWHLIRRANSLDGICQPVLEEIKRQTGRDDTILVHSGFEPNHLRVLESAASSPADNTIRLAYVGTIITEGSFLQMLAALDRVRKSAVKPVVLEFYGARGYRNRPWFNPDWMIEHGVFSDQGLVESLRRCSWGIVVMDLEGKDVRYSKFSFPNKIGTYLSAGVPVLGFGNSQSSLSEIMRDFPIGRFTNAIDEPSLETFLSSALGVPQPRSDFREDILSCARTEFNAELIRARLWNAWGVSTSGRGGV
jgi:hypothetical protein